MKRKERECNGTSDHIPDDLAMEILSRLPGKSLMKFQYLSKFWFSIIRSQRFIDSFISRSLNRGSRLLIAFNKIKFTDKKAHMRLLFFTASDEGENKSSSSSLVANLNMTIPACTVDCYYKRGNLAHGFICCSYQGQFLICNPTTRQIVTLPESGVDVNKKFTLKFLGYDPIDDQYKAMLMMVSRYGRGDVEHKVLTLGGGDIKTLSWRKIEDINTGPYVPYTKGICINGIVYYGATTMPNTDRVIVCFDVRFEKISLMNPPLYIKSWEVGTNLINYKGKLAIIHTTSFGASHGFILWILENVEKHEWSKKTFTLCKFTIFLRQQR